MQPTDQEIENAIHVMRSFTMQKEKGEAAAELCRLRELRTTWCGAGELQLRRTCDKFIAECGLTPNAALERRVPLEGLVGRVKLEVVG